MLGQPHTASNICLMQKQWLIRYGQMSTIFSHDGLVSCIWNTKQFAVLSKNLECLSLVIGYKTIVWHLWWGRGDCFSIVEFFKATRCKIIYYHVLPGQDRAYLVHLINQKRVIVGVYKWIKGLVQQHSTIIVKWMLLHLIMSYNCKGKDTETKHQLQKPNDYILIYTPYLKILSSNYIRVVVHQLNKQLLPVDSVLLSVLQQLCNSMSWDKANYLTARWRPSFILLPLEKQH